MNWVDVTIFTILAFFTLEGLSRPFFIEAFNLLGFLLAFFLSLKLYNLASTVLEKTFSLPHSLANVLGFIILWYLIEVIFFFITKKATQIIKLPLQFWGGQVLSLIPAFLRGLFFVGIILILVGTFPVQPRVKKDIRDSMVGSWLLAQTYQLETPIKSVFGGLANDTLSFLTIRPQSDERLNLGFNTGGFQYNQLLEVMMVERVNKERVKRGFPPLEFDQKLWQVARLHSGDMLKEGYFSHYSQKGEDVADRAAELGIDFNVIGENLAFAPSLDLAHNGLMSSPGHRANILSPDFRKVGIGVADSADFGIMFVQVFSD